MKRAFLPALMMTLLFTGCAAAKQTPQDFSRWQQELTEAPEIRFSARITGEWSEGTTSFTADVVCTGEETAVTVTAPETIAGVTARSRPDRDTLEYDGVILELAPGAPEALSPCGAGGILLEALTRGNLLYMGAERDYVTAAVAAPGGETVTVWFTRDNIPVYAEIARGETAELIISLDDWEIRGAEKDGYTKDEDLGGDIPERPAP